MKILTSAQVREADAYTIEHEPVSSILLMERAALGLTEKLLKLFDENTVFVIFCGPGNNGGDGLAVARLLFNRNRKSVVYIPQLSKSFSPDFLTNAERLTEFPSIQIIRPENIREIETINPNYVVIDAIFGSGLSRPLSGFAAEIVEMINNSACRVVSIDIPSGLSGEGVHNQKYQAIRAHHTLTFEFPFLAFFFAENQDYVGDFSIINIGIHPEIIKRTTTQYYFFEHEDAEKKIKKRKKFSHKGHYGHGLLISGSYGKAGAAVLAAQACIHSGIGLLTVLSPKKNVSVLQSTTLEAMTIVDSEEEFISKLPENINSFSAVAIGPAIGFAEQTVRVLFNLLTQAKIPIVADADALTILSLYPEIFSQIPENTIITPHPKEFERLFGKTNTHKERIEKQREISESKKIITILKGAHTSVAMPDGSVFFNSTGNPGMAKGGSGDVLTGILLSLLSQGYTPREAALLGVWLHGKAGDCAAEKLGQNFMSSSDLWLHLKDAFFTLSD